MFSEISASKIKQDSKYKFALLIITRTTTHSVIVQTKYEWRNIIVQ